MFNRYFKASILLLKEEGLGQIEDRAKRGFADSMYKLAVIHLDATFNIKNMQIAKEWLQQSAKRDYAPAMLELAYIYLDDTNPELKAVGITWLERAVILGHIESRNLLRYYQQKKIK